MAEKLKLKCIALRKAPLFWVIVDSGDQFRPWSGTAFFLDTGVGPFAVTAAHVTDGDHVIDGDEENCEISRVIALQLGDLRIDLCGPNELTCPDSGIDTATFRIDRAQIESLGKTVWPPAPPQEGQRVYFKGFPGTEGLLRHLPGTEPGAGFNQGGSGV